MQKIRTIKETVELIRQEDPNSPIGYTTIRTAILKGEIPSVRVGRKYLLNVEKVKEYFEKGKIIYEEN